MARRISPSQLRSKLRQAEQKQRQAFNKLNQAINKYNREVRSYNTRVRANRQRLIRELSRLSRQPIKTQYVVYRTSVETLHQTYSRLEHQAEMQQWDPIYNRVLDLSEREAANSLEVANHILGTESHSEIHVDGLQETTLSHQLREISIDLDNRWKGAVFALNPRNPDAARHFCTSAREIFAQVLEIKAPDSEVINLLPSCDRTEQGKPTRRSKIRYLLHRKGMTEGMLEEFVEQDMENIVQLFGIFNAGTHGSAGTYDFPQLNAIKKRVEDGIMFLAEIIGDQ